MEEILLDLKNVRKQYANFSLECSMQVKRGSITGLIGANGAGKTSIFKASLGLIHTDSGEIRMMGKTPQQLTNEEWEKIGVVLSDATFPNIPNFSKSHIVCRHLILLYIPSRSLK